MESLGNDSEYLLQLASAPSEGPGVYALLAGVTAPAISSVSPSAGTNDVTNTLVISGGYFLPPLEVILVDGSVTYTLPVAAISPISVTAVVSVYADKTFDFIVKSPPASVLLKDAAQIAKGSGVPNREKVGKVTQAQVEEICKTKMVDLTCSSMESAKRIIAGTARNMGIEVVD